MIINWQDGRHLVLVEQFLPLTLMDWTQDNLLFFLTKLNMVKKVLFVWREKGTKELDQNNRVTVLYPNIRQHQNRQYCSIWNSFSSMTYVLNTFKIFFKKLFPFNMLVKRSLGSHTTVQSRNLDQVHDHSTLPITIFSYMRGIKMFIWQFIFFCHALMPSSIADECLMSLSTDFTCL